MEGLIITHKGAEKVAAMEVKEIIGVNGKKLDSAVRFKVKSFDELGKLCYLSRSAKRVLILLGKFDASDRKKAKKSITECLEKTDLKEFKDIIKRSFSVECERVGEHDFNSVDVEAFMTGILHKKTGIAADYKNPYFIIHAFINQDKGYMGIDLAGRDLSKRNYKLLHYGGSIKGTLAYTLLRIAGVKKNSIILDPFCGTGVIAIEAALYQQEKSVNFYDKDLFFTKYLKYDFKKHDKHITVTNNVHALESKMKYVDITKKNSAVAGVKIDVQKAGVDWLDTFFKEESVDFIITKPLIPSKNVKQARAIRVYEEMFYNAAIVLKKSGRIAVITSKQDLLLERAKKYKFKLLTSSTVNAGKAEYTILCWGR